jgi:hypothetical protein
MTVEPGSLVDFTELLIHACIETCALCSRAAVRIASEARNQHRHDTIVQAGEGAFLTLSDPRFVSERSEASGDERCCRRHGFEGAKQCAGAESYNRRNRGTVSNCPRRAASTYTSVVCAVLGAKRYVTIFFINAFSVFSSGHQSSLWHHDHRRLFLTFVLPLLHT